jgi:hypothetical protein
MRFLKRNKAVVPPVREREVSDATQFLLPALRSTLTARRAERDFIESCANDREKEQTRLYEQAQSAGRIAAEKRYLAVKLTDEIESLERMTREIER